MKPTHRAEEAEVDQLRRRLEETERAMERIVAQMENVSDRLSPTLMADLLVQSQCPDQDKVPCMLPIPVNAHIFQNRFTIIHTLDRIVDPLLFLIRVASVIK